MKKPFSIMLSVLLAAAGLILIATAVVSGSLEEVGRQGSVQYIIAATFALLLVLALVFPLLAESGYRRLLRGFLTFCAAGMVMILIFLGFMWMLVSDGAVLVMLRVLLPMYGVFLCTGALAAYLLADRAYRVFMFSLARELPYAYYRYRT